MITSSEFLEWITNYFQGNGDIELTSQQVNDISDMFETVEDKEEVIRLFIGDEKQNKNTIK